MTRRLPPPCRYIYVIGPETGLQKIGIATDPRTRLTALQTASPVRLRLHASIAVPFGAAFDVERRAHAALRSAKASGEWFNVAPAEAIQAAHDAAALLGAAAETPPLPLFMFSAPSARPADELLHQPTSVWAALARIWRATRTAAGLTNC